MSLDDEDRTIHNVERAVNNWQFTTQLTIDEKGLSEFNPLKDRSVNWLHFAIQV